MFEARAERQVRLAFRAVLHREPDPGALATYVPLLRYNNKLDWLLQTLLASDEYRERTAPRPDVGFPLDSAPPIAIRSTCNAAEQQALWDEVARVWSALGQTDAHWSVLTQDRFRQDRLDETALAEFHDSGLGEVHRLEAWLARAGWHLGPDAICAEYGCGVGRITRSLARRFGRVTGFDVSPPHLAQALAQIQTDGIANANFVQVRGPADLAKLADTDLFFSVISLQHSPPPLIHEILTHAFAGLRPGGCAFFQVPTYAVGYSYDPATWQHTGKMEMHVLPQRTILDLAHRAGLMVAEIQPDWCVGRPGEWISTTFLLSKPQAVG